MPLTGQAKTDYQREYMRRRRSNTNVTVTPESIRPEQPKPVRPKMQRPEGVSDNQWAYIQMKAEQE